VQGNAVSQQKDRRFHPFDLLFQSAIIIKQKAAYVKSERAKGRAENAITSTNCPTWQGKISNQLKRTLRVLPLIRLAAQATFPQGGRLSKSVAFCGENLNDRVVQSKDKRIKKKTTCHPERSTANELTQLQNGYSRGAQSKFCG
jgi:hypothetical protein